ncbi:alpha/beta fold hydrolase [Actinoplanes friuliensis]|uniref:Alpha/beta hydrolase n=1 Tax=Actinoplanes friuliensis DSM 7358 TaxID=1246995 RepID=U5VYP4_9ACTN|nr:alpha/beta hydrolase [Actinoplanes friuliensis]AGZ41907.1 alpha/beta hydrolase [Actinoplanes friuliensis DSM 7358]
MTSEDIRLHHETLGDPGDPALLLIMGLGAQLIDWPQEFCEQLAARGFHVIRFDNRDAGLSTRRPEWGVPDLPAILAGDRTTVPYLLADLAADAAGLLGTLGIERAHVAGASLGGMVAQQLTIDHPDRVLSLCSIMSMTGDLTVGRPTPEAAAVLGRPPAPDREAAIANSVASSRIIGSPGFPAAEEELLRRAAAKYDRAYHPLGTLRQYAAVLASPDRTAALHGVKVPTVVIHGEDDPLIGVSGGRATAAAVPGAELIVIPGMGHDLPREVWPRIVEAIAANAGRAHGDHRS